MTSSRPGGGWGRSNCSDGCWRLGGRSVQSPGGRLQAGQGDPKAGRARSAPVLVHEVDVLVALEFRHLCAVVALGPQREAHRLVEDEHQPAGAQDAPAFFEQTRPGVRGHQEIQQARIYDIEGVRIEIERLQYIHHIKIGIVQPPRQRLGVEGIKVAGRNVSDLTFLDKLVDKAEAPLMPVTDVYQQVAHRPLAVDLFVFQHLLAQPGVSTHERAVRFVQPAQQLLFVHVNRLSGSFQALYHKLTQQLDSARQVS